MNLMFDTSENRMRVSFIYMKKVNHLNWKDAKSIHKLADFFFYERKMWEVLLIRILPNFNLSTGDWRLDDLPSSLVSEAFPKPFDLDPPPEKIYVSGGIYSNLVCIISLPLNKFSLGSFRLFLSSDKELLNQNCTVWFNFLL